MMNKRKIRIKYLLIFATLLFCSCQKKEGYTDLLNCEEIQYLKSEIINDSFVFASPKALLSYDSLLIVVDTRLNDSAFHLFRKNDGRFIQSGGCSMPGTPFISQTGVLSFWDMYKLKWWDMI